MMIYLKKLFSLGHKGLKKLVRLVRDRFDLTEVKILLTGLILSLLTCLYLLYLLFTNFGLYKILSSTAIVHIMGGRALGIAACLSADISIFYTILYNFFLEIVIVLITYSIMVLIIRNLIQPKLFRSAVKQAELAAQDQKTNIKKYGAIGLFLFVMLPFFMTGPVIGSLIGYLLNYKAINNFLIVFSGTLSSILIYALIGNNILKHINQYVQVDLVKKWAAIIVGILIVLFLIYHLKTVKAYLDEEIDGE
ncbi:MAG: small multi-drug export protein [Deltaproteobacteria bacterium]|nr:small multi-drug export protein [Deltaproteobacteria bacterium]